MVEVAAVGAVVCVYGCDEEGVSRATAAPLVAASEDFANRAVVAVRHGSFGAFCTGVLVAPRVVLTAKHCVQPSGASGPFDASEFTVESTPPDSSVWSDASGASIVRVRSVRTTPGAWSESPTGPIGALRGVDIAVLVLDREIDASPFGLAFGLTPAIGDDARVIAMGSTLDAGPGTRRALEVSVRQLDGTVVMTDGSACDGDSGGPLLDRAGRVRAILSSGASPCGTEGIEFDLVDVLREPIEAALAETGAASTVDASVEPTVIVAAGGCAVRPFGRQSTGANWLLFAAILARALERARRPERRTVSARRQSQTSTGLNV